MEKLLLEIGTEEIPAGYINPALSSLSSGLLKRLDDARIEHGEAVTFGTPKRLAVMVSDVALKQTSLSTEFTGPPEKEGFDDQGKVDALSPVGMSNVWINGGFFVFKRSIFDYIKEGEELVQEPFYRLIADRQLIGFKNPGFWACIDTMKEKKMFDDMYNNRETPWMIWNHARNNSPGVHQHSQD